MIKLKTNLSILIKSSINKGQQLYRLFLKGYMEIPFFPKYIYEEKDATFYDCLMEMQRMRMNWDFFGLVENTNGQICPSYPKYFVKVFLNRQYRRKYNTISFRKILIFATIEEYLLPHIIGQIVEQPFGEQQESKQIKKIISLIQHFSRKLIASPSLWI